MSDPLRQQSRTCCFCMTLKSGSYLAAAYATVVSVLGVGGSLLMIKIYQPMVREKAVDLMLEEHPDLFEEGYTRDEMMKLVTVTTWLYWVALGLYATWFLVSMMLILGVATKRRGLMLCFVLYTCIMSGLCGIGLINSLVNFRTTFADSAGVVAVVLVALIILLNIYAMWCVATHMRELKAAQCAGAVVSLATPLNPPPQYSPPEYAEYNKFSEVCIKQ